MWYQDGVTGQFQYKGKLGNGKFDTVGATQAWAKRIFGVKFVTYYYKFQEEQYLNTWLGAPDGFCR
eukprot:10065491-Ditylum_brightwellii.AAC.1